MGHCVPPAKRFNILHQSPPECWMMLTNFRFLHPGSGVGTILRLDDGPTVTLLCGDGADRGRTRMPANAKPEPVFKPPAILSSDTPHLEVVRIPDGAIAEIVPATESESSIALMARSVTVAQQVLVLLVLVRIQAG